MSVTEHASRRPASGKDDTAAIDVCVCTYRRPAVTEALRSIALQTAGARPIRIVVADNAAQPTAQALVAQTARETGLDVVYVHAPANNISIARNACLDAANGEWLAFLDDDEIASPGWLNGLIGEAERGQWDAVLGPVQAVYSDNTPAWVRTGNFHSTRPVFVRGHIRTGYTGNVLIRRASIGTLRFRTELGRTGGEDEDFFNRLHDAGGRIGYAPDALAYEAIPPDRATLKWLIRRSFRTGQTYGAGLRGRSRSAFARSREMLVAAAKAGLCGMGALTHLPLVTRRNRFLTRAALHCGVVARLAGMGEVKLY